MSNVIPFAVMQSGVGKLVSKLIDGEVVQFMVYDGLTSEQIDHLTTKNREMVSLTEPAIVTLASLRAE